MTSEEADAMLVKVNEALDTLREHFDAVRIFANTYEGGDTHTWTAGSGNWYALRGQIHDWSMRQDEEVRLKTHRDSSS